MRNADVGVIYRHRESGILFLALNDTILMSLCDGVEEFKAYSRKAFMACHNDVSFNALAKSWRVETKKAFDHVEKLFYIMRNVDHMRSVEVINFGPYRSKYCDRF